MGARLPIFTHFGAAIDITCVELDPEVIRMAKKYFGVAETPNAPYRSEGRPHFSCARPTRSYDLIMVDAYHGTFVPFHLLTRNSSQLLKSRLNPGGVVAQNIEPSTCSTISASRR